MTPSLVAVGQMTSTADVEHNLAQCRALVDKAKARGARLLVLPECFAFVGTSDEDTRRVAEPLDGPLFTRFAALAKDAALWVCFGGFPERATAGAREGAAGAAGAGGGDATTLRHHNAHVVVDHTGAVRAVYRKLHLFDVTLPNGTVYRESACTAPGKELVVVDDTPAGKLGLTVCYDLRFPELYRALAERGAELLLVPAAFTLLTGKEHWEPLLRARAIENECYVLAAAQTGRHNEKRDTYGHAMIIDPWGTIVAQARDGLDVAVAEIDPAFLASVRARIPVWQHRRRDVLP